MQAEGLSTVEMAKKNADMQAYINLYKNPLFVILLTYMEIIPVGLVVSLLAALAIKRKTKTVAREVFSATGAVKKPVNAGRKFLFTGICFL